MSPTPKPRGVIAVMGSTGSGKSDFVNAILGKREATVGEGLGSCTSEVGQYVHLHESGMDVRILDTPGFNDYSTQSDFKVLQMIGAFLKKEYGASQKFSGIIFLHDIKAPTLDWQGQRRNVPLFKKLCGTDSMRNVVVVTSFWDQMTNVADGAQKEGDLQAEDGFLKELHAGGAKFVRYGHFELSEQPQDPGFLTPKQVVDHLLSLDPFYVAMQEDVARGASLTEVVSVSSPQDDIERLRLETRESLDGMRQELESFRRADDVKCIHREELEQQTESMQERLNGWMKYGDDIRMQVAQWEEHRAQIATKEDLRGLQNEVMMLREENNKLRQIDQQRIDELNQAIARLTKDRDDLTEECKALRSGNLEQFQGFTASLDNVTRTYNRETERLQSLLTRQEEDLRQSKLECTQAQQEHEAARQLYVKSEAELIKLEASLKSSQKDSVLWKESHEKLSYAYDALEAEYNATIAASQQQEDTRSEMESLRQELQKANSANHTLEAENGELERALNEVHDTMASVASEVQDLRSENGNYQFDLQQRNEEIAKLRQELDNLRYQQPKPRRVPEGSVYSSSYPSPPTDNPYPAWNNPTGGPIAVSMPLAPPLPPRPQGISLLSHSPHPKSGASAPNSVPSPEANYGHRYQQRPGTANRLQSRQQQGLRPGSVARTDTPLQVLERHLQSASPAPRSQTPGASTRTNPCVARTFQSQFASLSVSNSGAN